MDHLEMTREETRRSNAKRLAEEAGGLAAFGKKLEMSDSQVSQIIGKTPKKNIGNLIARRIEVAFGKAEGWLDVDHQRDKVPDPAQGEPPASGAPEMDTLRDAIEAALLINAQGNFALSPDKLARLAVYWYEEWAENGQHKPTVNEVKRILRLVA